MDTFDYKKYLSENKLNENSEEAIRKAVKIYYSEKSKEDILEELFKIFNF